MTLATTIAGAMLVGATLAVPAFRWGVHRGRIDVLEDPDTFVDGVTDA